MLRFSWHQGLFKKGECLSNFLDFLEHDVNAFGEIRTSKTRRVFIGSDHGQILVWRVKTSLSTCCKMGSKWLKMWHAKNEFVLHKCCCIEGIQCPSHSFCILLSCQSIFQFLCHEESAIRQQKTCLKNLSQVDLTSPFVLTCWSIQVLKRGLSLCLHCSPRRSDVQTIGATWGNHPLTGLSVYNLHTIVGSRL